MPDFTGGQFPSLDGDPESEVAQRTEPDTSGDWFRKVFTVHNRHHTKGLPEDHEYHRTNFVSVLQAALQQGLHPKRAPELESEEPHPSDPNSTNITYRVHVVPSVADEHPETTVTPSTLPQVLADPDALVESDPVTEPLTDRWSKGEGGVGADGAPLLPHQPLQDPATVPPATPDELAQTPAPEAPAAPVEPVPTPTEPVAPADPAAPTE